MIYKPIINNESNPFFYLISYFQFVYKKDFEKFSLLKKIIFLMQKKPLKAYNWSFYYIHSTKL